MPSNDARITGLAVRLREERGQVLPLTALLMVVLVGFAAMVIDVGRVWVAQRQLQNAVDATALAIAQNMPNDYAGWCQGSGANASADCASLKPAPPALGFSGIAGAQNALYGYGVTADTPPTVTFFCSPNAPGYNKGQCPADGSTQDSAALCRPGDSLPPQPNADGSAGCNAVTVSESATVKSTFAGIFNFAQFTLSANATATAPQAGETPTPLNVELVIDSTPSMGYPQDGGDCTSPVTGISGTPEKIDCAKAGMRALLAGLAPCDPTLPTCGTATQNPSPELGANVADPLDEVGLVTFPALHDVTERTGEINCSNDNLQVEYPAPYSRPEPPGGEPGYDIVGLSSDYRTSGNAASLNPTSALVQSVYWYQCPGQNYPGNIFYGLESRQVNQQITYLAGALGEAQYLLSQASVSRPSAVNVIIVLSDGELNNVQFANGGHDDTPCASAEAAANAVKSTKTLIYSIAYDSHQDCTDGSGDYHGVRGLQLMEDIASSPSTFFNQPNAGDLTKIFQQISNQLAQINTRLIPSP